MKKINCMRFTSKQKDELKRKLVSCLRPDNEIVKIVIFGSFVNSDNPHDIDVAIFQDSSEDYLPLAMKYRKGTPRNKSTCCRVGMQCPPDFCYWWAKLPTLRFRHQCLCIGGQNCPPYVFDINAFGQIIFLKFPYCSVHSGKPDDNQ